MNLVSVEQRLFPLRGLVLLQNVKGAPFDSIAVKRWIRLNHAVQGVLKIDVFASGAAASLLPDLLDYAARVDVALSLRTDCTTPPPDLHVLRDAGLFDVYLTPLEPHVPALEPWFDACHDAGVPMRLQLLAPFERGYDVAAVAERIARAGVAAVNVALEDPFIERPGCRTKADSLATVDVMNDLVLAIEGYDVEANLLWLPLCLVRAENLVRAANLRQFAGDHQQYHFDAYGIARRLRNRSPLVMGMLIQSLLWRDTVAYSIPDQRLLSWLLDSPARYAKAAFWHKVTRRWRGTHRDLDIEEYTQERHEAECRRERKRRAKTLGAACTECSLRRICDNVSGSFRRALTGLSVSTQEGDGLVVSPMHFVKGQRKYYDAIDAERLERDKHYLELEDAANRAVRRRPPDRVLGSREYTVENAYFHNMEAGIRWFSVLNCEKTSAPLPTLAPPFTIAVIVSGGVADYIGFMVARESRVLCPMEEFRH
ncbi:MAG TPA: hypothetical protein ENN80_14780, partial [Candidatus Hydrogenedentes bacterium]|nr:hypothetical protein [Candidatus Hydrogenedentota bacterium]